MYLIALTGGIASGKSLVASRLAELGAAHIDADKLAREVVEPGSDGLAEIAESFGTDMVRPDGSLDREALGALVFSDPDHRQRLNEITHPRVRALTAQRIREAADRDPDAVVLYDVPLLAETRGDGPSEYDAIVVVHTDTEERIRRMVELRGMTAEEAHHRLNSQATDTERLAIADVVLDNNGDVDALMHQVDDFWASLTARVGSSSTT